MKLIENLNREIIHEHHESKVGELISQVSHISCCVFLAELSRRKKELTEEEKVSMLRTR